MKVAVDGYLFKHPTRGMTRFAKMLVNGIGSRAITLEPGHSLDLEVHSHTSRKRPNFPLWEQWILPRLARKKGANILLCPYNTGPLRLDRDIRMILVLHDLIFLDKTIERSISRVQNVGRHYRRLIAPAVAKRASHIVTVSEFSKKLIVSRLGVAESRITVIPNTIGEFWFQPVQKKPQATPYILTVAGEAPSKNLARFICAFAQVLKSSPPLRLIVVGVKPGAHLHFQQLAAVHQIAGEVTMMPFVSDDELRTLYWNADLFVCPSLSEGFGIPILEAMAAGVPVACSQTTSLPEVAGDVGWYFDPYQTGSITSTILEVLRHGDEAQNRVHRGRLRAALFSELSIASKVKEFWLHQGIL